MDEEIINKFLRRGLQNGTVPFELTDGVVDHWLAEESQEFPDSICLGIQSKLKLRLQDARLRAASESLREPVAPVGRLIQAIRTEAGIPRADVAERLGTSDEHLAEIEDDMQSIPDVTPGEFVVLMEIFHITHSRVLETIRRTNESLLGIGLTFSTGIATGLQREKENATSRKSGSPNVSAARKEAAEIWLQNLQMELHKRDRTDLLG
jgi:hypothetical protein